MKWQRAIWLWLLIALLGFECLQAQTVRRYGVLAVNKAQYGKHGAWVDVTDRVRSLIRDNSLDFRVNASTLGGDVSPGPDNALRLTYTYMGTKYTITVKEGNRCHAP